MSDSAGQFLYYSIFREFNLNFGKVEEVEVELELDEQYKDEATRIQEEHYYKKRYFVSKTLKIQTFDIKKFSAIDFTKNINTIIEYIGSTVSDNIDGIKFKSGSAVMEPGCENLTTGLPGRTRLIFVQPGW